jgi:aromatic ring-opening dioxygenase catalytic subunit (LigB family)
MEAPVRQPTLFIPHGGGPCFFMDPPPSAPHLWDRMAAYLRGIAGGLPAPPRAILLISGHWEAERATLNIADKPSLLFDYYGFPEHTYHLTYPAPGAPWLADRVASLLEGAGMPTDAETARGWDHGVFIPLLLMFPAADTPILQLSLRADLDPAAHLAMGRALAPLRDEGVLIVGSGMSYHNNRAFFATEGNEGAERFDAWLTQSVAEPAGREAALNNWSHAPFARACHPREEHLLPLMVAAGAAAGEPGAHAFSDRLFGKAVSGFQFG